MLRLGSRLYRYDRQHFTYVPARVETRHLILRLAVCFLLAGIVTALSFPSWKKIESIAALRHQEALLADLQHRVGRMQALEKSLDKVHHNDKSFYRSILNLTPTDQAVWDGGKGGSDKFVRLHPLPIRQLAILDDKLKHKFQLQRESFELLEKVAQQKSEELSHIPAIRPLGGRIVSGFGYRRDPFHGHSQFHAGVDFDARMGTKAFTVADGVVITAGYPESGYGLQIEVNHGYGYVTKYAHLSKTLVTVGQKVKRGDLIGLTGNTGYSTGPHLHYEVIKHGQKVNPYDYFYAE